MLQRLTNRLAPFVLMTMMAFGADLTGKWTGTFEELTPDGSVRRTGGAYVELKLSGQTVTGTAGPSESEQLEIRNGKLEQGTKLTFEVPQRQGPIMKFDLVFDGDTIKGAVAREGDGRRIGARIDLKRKTIDRPGDREAIRTHIDRIFQAFIKKDTAALRATHAEQALESEGELGHASVAAPIRS